MPTNNPIYDSSQSVRVLHGYTKPQGYFLGASCMPVCIKYSFKISGNQKHKSTFGEGSENGLEELDWKGLALGFEIHKLLSFESTRNDQYPLIFED